MIATAREILSWASDIAFVCLVPIWIWLAIEQRRLRKQLQGMEPTEVVESARMIQRMAPALLRAMHGVQRAWGG